MGYVNDYPATSTFNSDDYALITGKTGGMRRMSIEQFKQEMASLASDFTAIMSTCPAAVSHRILHRGKNLGTSITSEQIAAIRNGSFTDMYVRDYWTINGVVYRIADINLFINTGDTQLIKPHLVIVRDGLDLWGDGSTTHYMNDTDTTAGGFKGSKMWTDTIPNKILPTYITAFGDYLLSHREYISNAVDDTGTPSGGEWVDAKYMIFSEPQYYGTTINSNDQNGAGLFNNGIGYRQIELFKDADMRNRGLPFWFRNIVNVSQFSCAHGDGFAGGRSASDAGLGVLGYVLIG